MAVAIGILLVVAGTAWIALITTIALLFSAAGILDNWAFVAGALVLGSVSPTSESIWCADPIVSESHSNPAHSP